MCGGRLMNADHKCIQIAPSDQYKEHGPAHARTPPSGWVTRRLLAYLGNKAESHEK
jgi:hypothetical protein